MRGSIVGQVQALYRFSGISQIGHSKLRAKSLARSFEAKRNYTYEQVLAQLSKELGHKRTELQGTTCDKKISKMWGATTSPLAAKP